jgi:hypothetical protein
MREVESREKISLQDPKTNKSFQLRTSSPVGNLHKFTTPVMSPEARYSESGDIVTVLLGSVCNFITSLLISLRSHIRTVPFPATRDKIP